MKGKTVTQMGVNSHDEAYVSEMSICAQFAFNSNIIVFMTDGCFCTSRTPHRATRCIRST